MGDGHRDLPQPIIPISFAIEKRGRVKQKQLVSALVVLSGVGLFLAFTISLWRGPFTSDKALSVVIYGVIAGAALAISASGLVVTYTTSGVFNFAHGAIGMLMAFIYWELRFNEAPFIGMQLPAPVALLVTVGIIAPLFGIMVERVLMRRIMKAPLVVQLVVTIALMFLILALVKIAWKDDSTRPFPAFFGQSSAFAIGGVNIAWSRFITLLIAIGLAIFLRILLFKTRIGVAMRAVVDNKELAALNGARPDAPSRLSWALASSLAATAGILAAPEVGLSSVALTLLIVNAFAAAIFGRLKSLPLTFLGALILGLLSTFGSTFWDLTNPRWAKLPDNIPTIFLIFVLLALPQDRLEFATTQGLRRLFRTPKLHEAAMGFGAITLFVVAMSYVLNDTSGLNRITTVLVTAVLLLSYVPLAGWAGQVSLGQVFFVGIGILGFTRSFAGQGRPIGFVTAAVAATVAGVVVALPALRLRGLYLALATFAVARGASLFYSQPFAFGSRAVEFVRPKIFGISLDNQRTFIFFCALVFTAIGMCLVAVRRSRFGRRLIAMKDSPAACATLGVNLTMTKLAVFAMSASIAGIAGVLSSMNLLSGSDGKLDAIGGLGDTLIAVIGGVSLVSGAFAGGVFSQFIVFIQEKLVAAPFSGLFSALEKFGPAFASLNIMRDPDGAAGGFVDGFSRMMPWNRGTPAAIDPNEIGDVAGAGDLRPFTNEDLNNLDRRLGVPAAFRLPDHDIDVASLAGSALRGRN